MRAEAGRADGFGATGSASAGGSGIPIAATLGIALATGLALAPLATGTAPGTDQTLFLGYARSMLHGAALYADVWDNKQPGVFGLYAAMQALFGEGWSGVVTGYFAWMAIAAALLALVARVAMPGSRAWLLVVPCTLGMLLVRSNNDHIAQVEEWVALPLSAILLACVLPDRAGRPSTPRWLLVGVFTALVATLKLVLVPVAAAIIAATLGARVLSGQLTARHALAAIAVSIAGFGLACVPVFGWFLLQGTLPEFLWTTFAYPRLAVGSIEVAPVRRLVDSLGWLAKSVAPLLPAVALSLLAVRRAPASRTSVAVAGALAWIIGGLAMIVAQKFSWWTYHMALPMWPIGLLAAIGCAAPGAVSSRGPAGSAGSPRLAAFAAACCIAGLALYGALLLWKRSTSPDWPYTAVQASSIGTARSVARATSPACGTSFAIGDQAGLQAATGMRQALPVHGVFWGAFLPAQVERLPAELAAARPDLVYFDGEHRADFLRRFPDVRARLDRWLSDEYVARATDAFDGQWWERATERRAGPCPPATRFVVPGR